MGCRCGKGERVNGRDSSEDEARVQEAAQECDLEMHTSDSSFYTADEEMIRSNQLDPDIREYKRRLLWSHPHRDPEVAFKARAHEAITNLNRKRERVRDGDEAAESSFRDLFYTHEYGFGWRECMLLFLQLMELNLINPPTVTVEHLETKHGNEFNYKLVTALPWLVRNVLDIESVDFNERGHMDTETQITAYTLHNVTNNGGKYLITEYCEYQFVSETKTSFRKMVKTECPEWIPDWVIDKACSIYIKSTEKRCKKNVKLLQGGLEAIKSSCHPACLAQIGRLGLSFHQPLGAAAECPAELSADGESVQVGVPLETKCTGDKLTNPRAHPHGSSGSQEKFWTPRSRRDSAGHSRRPSDQDWFRGQQSHEKQELEQDPPDSTRVPVEEPEQPTQSLGGAPKPTEHK
eukprot:TRINITY_DN20744_c0_g1_i3.p1 TRINITY_DN20744_c0_g1~~TRINITY_DN20744_c0_g1_i3.p1  ORF type:complete len:406 (+),score=80.35 TRINITY_DN20744_c0_g1_i3:222-1439(+)